MMNNIGTMEAKTTPCPSCGHCPTCGRGGHVFQVIPYWIPTYQLYFPNFPTWYTSGGLTDGGNTISSQVTS